MRMMLPWWYRGLQFAVSQRSAYVYASTVMRLWLFLCLCLRLYLWLWLFLCSCLSSCLDSGLASKCNVLSVVCFAGCRANDIVMLITMGGGILHKGEASTLLGWGVDVVSSEVLEEPVSRHIHVLDMPVHRLVPGGHVALPALPPPKPCGARPFPFFKWARQYGRAGITCALVLPQSKLDICPWAQL